MISFSLSLGDRRALRYTVTHQGATLLQPSQIGHGATMQQFALVLLLTQAMHFGELSPRVQTHYC